jgi:hypothetical protein
MNRRPYTLHVQVTTVATRSYEQRQPLLQSSNLGVYLIIMDFPLTPEAVLLMAKATLHQYNETSMRLTSTLAHSSQIHGFRSLLEKLAGRLEQIIRREDLCDRLTEITVSDPSTADQSHSFLNILNLDLQTLTSHLETSGSDWSISAADLQTYSMGLNRYNGVLVLMLELERDDA